MKHIFLVRKNTSRHVRIRMVYFGAKSSKKPDINYAAHKETSQYYSGKNISDDNVHVLQRELYDIYK